MIREGLGDFVDVFGDVWADTDKKKKVLAL
jgi:hypothetical protein